MRIAFVFAAVVCTIQWRRCWRRRRVNPTDPQPSCNMCPGTYIPLSELDAYTKKAMAEKLTDQQMRDIDIGKAHVGIGMVYRPRLDKPLPNSVAEHDLVSEVYHIISGSATLVLGPDIVNRQRRPATLRTVVEFNGPGTQRIGDSEWRGTQRSRRAMSSSFQPAQAIGLRRLTITSTI